MRGIRANGWHLEGTGMSSWITRLQRLSRTTGVERAVRQIQTLTTQFLDLTSAPTELPPVAAPSNDWTTPVSRVEETVAEDDEEPEGNAGEIGRAHV